MNVETKIGVSFCVNNHECVIKDFFKIQIYYFLWPQKHPLNKSYYLG